MSSFDTVQPIQTAYRRRILECWHIPLGAKVLEVGCGQGDMTAVLAEAVGPTGHVAATDIASADYGSPLTLWQASDLIKWSEVGDWVDFYFECDITQFDQAGFDYAVMAHSSWYFESADQLGMTLRNLSTKAKYLCFAEWNTVPRSSDQTAHLMAVFIQGYMEAFKTEGNANVRSPFTINQLKQIIVDSGWRITSFASPDTSGLQDADWEIAECIARVKSEVQDPGISPKRLSLLEGQIDTLRQIAKPSGNVPLSSVALVAERA